MRISSLHPFPARMAPEIAIAELGKIRVGSTVLDPMMGSGTVVRHAIQVGHKAIGFDLDPLALLMVRVWTTFVPEGDLQLVSDVLRRAVEGVRDSDVHLSWIDEDEETCDFVNYWFAALQRRQLRKIAYVLYEMSLRWHGRFEAALNVMRVALSRIIITKNGGASLARDTSHSRPHRVRDYSDFDVVEAFFRSVNQVRKRTDQIPGRACVKTSLGDARALKGVKAASVDLVITSPPYLNAIDYMRGHKLSLVWLGYTVAELRTIRGNSIGAERKANEAVVSSASVAAAMVDADCLTPRMNSMVRRYATDQLSVMREVARVLNPNGSAIAVVGNSCLRGTFIRNSCGVIEAAKSAGLELTGETVRELPSGSRYLPTPVDTESVLGKRMRTECVLRFKHKAQSK